MKYVYLTLLLCLITGSMSTFSVLPIEWQDRDGDVFYFGDDGLVFKNKFYFYPERHNQLDSEEERNRLLPVVRIHTMSKGVVQFQIEEVVAEFPHVYVNKLPFLILELESKGVKIKPHDVYWLVEKGDITWEVRSDKLTVMKSGSSYRDIHVLKPQKFELAIVAKDSFVSDYVSEEGVETILKRDSYIKCSIGFRTPDGNVQLLDEVFNRRFILYLMMLKELKSDLSEKTRRFFSLEDESRILYKTYGKKRLTGVVGVAEEWDKTHDDELSCFGKLCKFFGDE
jgi:hypothetical protein